MAEYKVGYKKPPPDSQFKPGNRANPHGRRGKQERRTEAEIVRDVLNGLMDFREGSKPKRMRCIEVIVKSFGAAALKGDIGAAEGLLKMRTQFEKHRAIEPVVVVLSKRDMNAA
jgi:hypothetical protein